MIMMAALAAAPANAQDTSARGWQNASAYLTGMGGVTQATGDTTGDFTIEGGVRILPHVMVIGNVGYFHNLLGDLQPTLDATTAALSANQGLTVVGGGTLPTWYTTGGLRAELPMSSIVLPYVMGTIGVARLNPTPTFTFASGTLPDGSTPTVGQDVTSAVVSTGVVMQPPASSAFMLTLGGGVQVPIAPRWVVDVGYRYSRIAADSTLSAGPLNANGATFGLGYRF
jgi:opacity protein-like surface antigen